MTHNQLLACLGRPDLTGCGGVTRYLGHYWVAPFRGPLIQVSIDVCDECDLAFESRSRKLTNIYPYRPNIRTGRRRPRS